MSVLLMLSRVSNFNLVHSFVDLQMQLPFIYDSLLASNPRRLVF